MRRVAVVVVMLAAGVVVPATDAAAAVVPDPPATAAVYRVVARNRVAWQPGYDGADPITEYRVYRATGDGQWEQIATAAPTATRYDDVTVTPGTTYAYAVSAVNGVGEGQMRTTSAQLATRGEVLFNYGADDANWGVYAQNASADPYGDGTLARFDTVVDGTDHITSAVSPDGLTLAYGAPGGGTGYDIWLRGFAPSDVPVRLTTLSGDEYQPAWSPDGRTIAFTRVVAGSAPAVWTVPDTGGTPVMRAAATYDPSWLPDSASVVVVDAATNPTRLVRVTSSGARSPITGTAGGIDPSVSPDGTSIAFALWNQPNQLYFLAVVPASGAATPQYVESNATEDEPAWRADGKRIFYTGTYAGNKTIQSIGWTGTSFGSLARITDGLLDRGSTYRSLGVHLTSAPHLTGRSPAIGFATTAPFAGETTTCRLDGGSATPCTSPWIGASLSGGPHTLVVKTMASGEYDSVTAHNWTVDATPPTVTMSAPTSAVTLAAAVPVAYHATDSHGVASYDLRYRTAAPGGTYGAYVYPADRQHATATSASVAASPGTEVCFSVRAEDNYGNVSAWLPDRCSAVAYDDRQLGASPSWRRTTSSLAYLGTLTVSASHGAVLSRKNVTAARIYLVAIRCPGCGSVDVRVGGVLFGRIDLDATTTSRAVFALPARAAVAGTLTVTVASGTAPVRIDGIAILRR